MLKLRFFISIFSLIFIQSAFATLPNKSRFLYAEDLKKLQKVIPAEQLAEYGITESTNKSELKDTINKGGLPIINEGLGSFAYTSANDEATFNANLVKYNLHLADDISLPFYLFVGRPVASNINEDTVQNSLLSRESGLVNLRFANDFTDFSIPMFNTDKELSCEGMSSNKIFFHTIGRHINNRSNIPYKSWA